MNKHLLHYGVIAAVGACTIVPGSLSVRAADVVAQDAASGRLPINLARGDLGTRLETRAPKVKNLEKKSLEENDSAQALISDDAALTYPLLPGTTSIIVILSKIQVLNHFNFINFDAAGKYSLSVSSTKLGFDAPGWRKVASGENFDSAQVVATDIGAVEARYIKIDFDTERPGRISGLGLFGAPTIGTYQKKPLGYAFVSGSAGVGGLSSPGSPTNVYFDLANLDTGSRVVGLSRGGDLESAQSMIDGNVESSFAFDSTDPAPAAVVDFGVRRAINRLSCVYDAPPGRLDFYLVDNPYPKQDQHASIAYVDSPSVQPVANESGEYSGRSGSAGRQAIYSVNTSSQPGLNRLAVDMASQRGRFLVAEFHPIATGAAPAGDFKDFKDRDFKDKPDFKDKAVAGQPLRILSLSAFGEAPNDQVVPLIPPVTNNPPGGGGGGTVPPTPPGVPPAGAMTP